MSEHFLVLVSRLTYRCPIYLLLCCHSRHTVVVFTLGGGKLLFLPTLLHMRARIHTWARACVRVHTHTRTCTHTHTQTHILTWVHLPMLSIYLSIYLSSYIYISIYICLYFFLSVFYPSVCIPPFLSFYLSLSRSHPSILEHKKCKMVHLVYAKI